MDDFCSAKLVLLNCFAPLSGKKFGKGRNEFSSRSEDQVKVGQRVQELDVGYKKWPPGRVPNFYVDVTSRMEKLIASRHKKYCATFLILLFFK